MSAERPLQRVHTRLGADCVAGREALVDSDEGRMLLADLKADPGQVGLETLLREIDQLAAVRRMRGRYAVALLSLKEPA